VKIAGGAGDGGRTRGSVSFHLAVSHPIVSTGAGIRARISRIASYVSRHRAGAGCGVSRACLISLAFPFDFPFAFLGDASAESSAVGRTTSVASASTLTRFASRSKDSSAGSSSLNSVTDWLAELCCATRRDDRVEEPPRLFMVVYGPQLTVFGSRRTYAVIASDKSAN
jgi:hypothetical protein